MTRSAAFLDALLDQDREALVAAGRPCVWDRGERLVRRGEPAETVILLRAGLVKVHLVNADGREVLLGLAGPGDLLGEVAVVRDAPRSADVTALESVTGVVIPVSRARLFLTERHHVMLALLDLALRRLHLADARRLEFATAESLARVTSRLVELAERFGSAGPEGRVSVRLPLTQEELASWSASSRESTARALRTLRELGLIETHRFGLLVHDLDGLRAHRARL